MEQQPNPQAPGITDTNIIRTRAKKFKDNKGVNGKIAALRNEIALMQKQFNHQGPQKLAQIYTNKEDNQHDALIDAVDKLKHMLEPLKDIRTKNLKRLGLTYEDKLEDKQTGFAALMQLDAEKMNIDPKEVPAMIARLESELAGAGIKVSRSILRELVLIDDWSAIWNIAKPLVMKYGLPALAHVYHTYLQPKISKWIGDDEGFNPKDFVGSGLRPQITRYEPGFNKEIPGVVLPKWVNNNTVSSHYIKTIICPEIAVHRMATKNPQKTALMSATLETTVQSNSSGAAGVYIFGSAGASAMAVGVNNAATFSSSTGSQSSTTTPVAGPFYSLRASLSKIRLVSMSTQVIPIISNNSPGSLQIGYWQQSDIAGIVGVAPTYTTAATDLVSAPWYVSGNARAVYRMVTLPSDYEGTTFSAPTVDPYAIGSTVPDLLYILATGFTGSSVVLKIVITYVYDFIPQSSYIPITPMAYPQPGPASLEFAASVFSTYPILQNMTLYDAKNFVNSLPDETMPYDLLQTFFEKHTKNIKQSDTGHILPTSNDIEMMRNDISDLIIE